MTPFLKKYRIISLLFFALLSGIIWRIEVEYHGWKGLIWLSYYHLAIPSALVLFLIWSNISIQLKLPQRIGLNLTAIVLAVAVTILLEQSFRRTFFFGPSALLYIISDDPLKFLAHADYFIVGLLPVSMALISRIFGIVCKPVFVVISTVVMAVSPDVTVILLDVFKDKGNPDYIHAIKSGYLMAFWFLALGLVFIRSSVKTHARPLNMTTEILDDKV